MSEKGPKEIAKEAVAATKELAGRAVEMGKDGRAAVLDAQKRVQDVADDVATQATSATMRTQAMVLEAKEKAFEAVALAQARTREVADTVHDTAYTVASMAGEKVGLSHAANAFRMMKGSGTDTDLNDESRSSSVVENESVLEAPEPAIDIVEPEIPEENEDEAVVDSEGEEEEEEVASEENATPEESEENLAPEETEE